MKYLTICTENNHYDEFLQYVKKFRYIEKLELRENNLQETDQTDEGDTREEIIANVRAGYEEMLLIKQGKLKGIPWEEFLIGLEEESNEL